MDRLQGVAHKVSLPGVYLGNDGHVYNESQVVFPSPQKKKAPDKLCQPRDAKRLIS